MARQDLIGRTFRFAVEILNLHPRISAQSTAFAYMAQQLFEAASSIPALLEEGEVAASRRDLAAKQAIALRESREARHWLRLISRDPKWAKELAPHIQEAHEFVAMLTVSVRKLRRPPDKSPE